MQPSGNILLDKHAFIFYVEAKWRQEWLKHVIGLQKEKTLLLGKIFPTLLSTIKTATQSFLCDANSFLLTIVCDKFIKTLSMLNEKLKHN